MGQAFADQIFRVFANAHPEVEINVKNANQDILDVIAIVKANGSE
ncbi:MAG: STAS-like domain-containing protein [Sutterella sp.]